MMLQASQHTKSLPSKSHRNVVESKLAPMSGVTAVAIQRPTMSHDVQCLISKHGILSNKGSTEKATDPARFQLKFPPEVKVQMLVQMF